EVALRDEISVLDREWELGERAERGTEHDLGAVQHVEGRLVARAQQLVRLRLVEPDGTSRVRAHLRVRDEAVRRPGPAPGTRSDQPGLDVHQDDLTVRGVRVTFGERGHEPLDGHVLGADRCAVLRHEALAPPPGRRQQRVAGSGPERRDREQRRDAERPGRRDEPTDDEPPARDEPLALEVLREQRELLLAARQRLARLLVRAVRHETVRPRHEAEPEAAQRDAEQDPLGLRLPADHVDPGEPDAAEEAQHEPEQDRGLTAAVASLRGRARAARLVRFALGRHVFVPIQRTATRSRPIAITQATRPSGSGPRNHRGRPPRSWGWRRYRTYATTSFIWSWLSAAVPNAGIVPGPDRIASAICRSVAGCVVGAAR